MIIIYKNISIYLRFFYYNITYFVITGDIINYFLSPSRKFLASTTECNHGEFLALIIKNSIKMYLNSTNTLIRVIYK